MTDRDVYAAEAWREFVAARTNVASEPVDPTELAKRVDEALDAEPTLTAQELVTLLGVPRPEIVHVLEQGDWPDTVWA